ncbi:MAG TPA: ATP-dependent DNA helicase [Methanocorpusculum sp.]|nr:ATP-dependent DNA helicase [Methanocorpusculum sp.]
MMKIDSLPIPNRLRTVYLKAGITGLYPPQEECVKAGLFERKNILAAIPTASGKTLVAECAMQKEIAAGGKCLYIVPLKALASEKYEDFSGKGVSVGIATGDPDQKDEYLGRYDIVVATSEKTDSLLRNRAEWIKRVSLLVVDEIHLIGDESRGATLEMVIAKLRHQNPEMQIIGLSATMGNPEELAKWLDAALITSEWRPVDLREGVFYNGEIRFHEGKREVPPVKKDDDINLLLDTVEEGGQCLVFVSSRRSAEAYAKRAASALKRTSPALESYAAQIEKADATASGKVLADSVRKGAAFHHAGLPRAARVAVEEGFRKGDILVISSTPTLAAGLNLPARRVIIRDYQRYDAHLGMNPIPVMEYRQMAGRAGRPHLDPYGEAVLIAKDEGRVDDLFEDFIDAPAEKIKSQCQRETELRAHLLALIATGFAETRSDISAFMERSFYASQKVVHRRLDKNIESALSFLEDAEMIESVGDAVSSTYFGSLSSKLYLAPESALMIKAVLAAHANDSFSAFAVLHLLCMTPDMFRFYLKASDERLVDDILAARGEELWFEELSEEFFGALKSAAVLEEWISETPEEMISERYSIGSGDVHAAVENLKWLLHAASRIAHEFAPALEEDVKRLEIRVENGIREELIPLISLKGIGRVRARRLFERGITDPASLLKAGKASVVPILGTAVAEKVFAEAKRKILGSSRVADEASGFDEDEEDERSRENEGDRGDIGDRENEGDREDEVRGPQERKARAAVRERKKDKGPRTDKDETDKADKTNKANKMDKADKKQPTLFDF